MSFHQAASCSVQPVCVLLCLLSINQLKNRSVFSDKIKDTESRVVLVKNCCSCW